MNNEDEMIFIKKIALLIISIIIPFFSIAQIQQYDIGDISYITPLPKTYHTRINSKKNIPISIDKLITSQILSQTGIDSSKLKFKFCDIFEVKKYLTDYPDSVNKHLLPIPKYFAIFDWTDTTIGVTKHNIILSMDSFGQIIYLNFPHKHNNQRYNLLSLDSAKFKADSIININDIKYADNDIEINMFYNIGENDLFWTFTYIQDIFEKDTYIESITRTLSFSMITHKLYRNNTQRMFYFRL